MERHSLSANHENRSVQPDLGDAVTRPETHTGDLPEENQLEIIQHKAVKKRRSGPREMSSKHKILNSSSDDSLHEKRALTDSRPRQGEPGLADPVDSAAAGTMESHLDTQEPTKRGRGRPRKYPKKEPVVGPKRGRGRPRKSSTQGPPRSEHAALCQAFVDSTRALVKSISAYTMQDPSRYGSVLRSLSRAQVLGEALLEHSESDLNNDEVVATLETVARSI